DRVWLFDEEGRRYRAEVASVREREAESVLSILEVLPPWEVQTRIILAPALLKAGTMDDVILKATELGVSRIAPVESERSVVRSGERTEKKVERWARIARTAAKQSRAAYSPIIDPPVRLEKFISSCRSERRFFLNEHGGASLKRLRTEGGEPPSEAAVLVGPEGSWSGNEEKAIAAAGFEPVRLGRTILRAETAVLTLFVHEWNW
ncbi:MAG: 16S rRNA (uracil(1498)-N(3))-methyltransferase, partial [Candidatus Aminicenantes bacterium]|nr:16S rRNA (uracil(1498)-N(3))-methyltransferase [Candidatus Aminicenantes bacterium]